MNIAKIIKSIMMFIMIASIMSDSKSFKFVGALIGVAIIIMIWFSEE